MTPGKLLSEIQVGGGSNGKYGLDRRAYYNHDELEQRDAELVDLRPSYWVGRLTPPSWASGVVARYPFGLSAGPVYSARHDKDFRNPFDQPFRFTLAEGTAWADALFAEANHAAESGVSVYWYHGKPGIGLYDSLALDIVKNLPGTHIVDATNGADGRPEWMPSDWWGEAMGRIGYSELGAMFNIPTMPAGNGQYAFADNALAEGGDERIKDAVVLARDFNFPTILSCHRPEHFEWLLGDTVTTLVNGPADMPTWKVLLKSGINLAFRGDEEKVNADLGGRLSELREVAG